VLKFLKITGVLNSEEADLKDKIHGANYKITLILGINHEKLSK
jgi:hypothetical protein